MRRVVPSLFVIVAIAVVVVARACSVRAATKSSWMPGPASTRVAAVQSWPALK